ncbi:MAG: aminotransferase class IV [Halobacteriales archaeon]
MAREAVVDGAVVDETAATVNVRDRGFRYGDAAFETMRVYAGSLFAWTPHADRLEATCEAIGLDHGLDRDTLLAHARRAIAANDLREGAVRLSITRGVQPGALAPTSPVEPTVVVTVRSLPRGGLDGEPVWDAPAAVRVVETRKIPDACLPAAAKTHNYLNGVLARLELPDGADEALLRDLDGRVVEGTTSNLFLVRDGTLVTPPTSAPVLPGVTRAGVLALAGALDVPVERRAPRPAELSEADEAFLTNTSWEVRPIGAVDGAAVGGGPVTDRLRSAFAAAVERAFYAGE